MNSNLKSIEQPEPGTGCLIGFLIFAISFALGVLTAVNYLT